MTYQQQIKHPNWQKKRLEVLEANKFQCKVCKAKDQELHVHHPVYKRGAMIWEYTKEELECLCFKCHKDAHEIDEKIKKALATCRDKNAVLSFILAVNAGKAKKTTALKKRKCAVDIDKFRQDREDKIKKEEDEDQQALEVVYAEFPQLRPIPTDTEDQRADKFFAKMKILLSRGAK